MDIEDLDYDMYIDKLDTKRYKMKIVEQSYEIMNGMLADEELTNQDKITALNSFIYDVKNGITDIILSPDDLIECCDLLKTFANKIKELKEDKDV